MGLDECKIHSEIIDNESGEVLGTAWGDRASKIFAEAYEMFYLLKEFVTGEPNADDYMSAQKLIDRVENSPELKCDGLTERELLDDIVWGGKEHDHARNQRAIGKDQAERTDKHV